VTTFRKKIGVIGRTCLLIYLVALILLPLVLKWVGEKNVATALLLYAPPSLWFIPLPFLLWSAFHFGRLWMAGTMFAGVAASLMLSGWQFHKTSTSEGAVLRVMTCNRGQQGSQSQQGFKNSTRPDILVLQEAAGRSRGLAKSPENAEFTHSASVGEHTILSRFPVLGSSILPAGAAPRQARAVRFVVNWFGRKISVYSVHLRTPRDALRAQWPGALVYGVLGLPGTVWGERRKQYQAFWDGQIADAKMILEAAREDPLPVILAGDFNAPHSGHIRHLLARELSDAHEEAGNGCGFTFPGVTRNPLSLGGPWLRIDYIFFNHEWSALQCVTERDRPSQHRAVMARLVLRDDPPSVTE